VAACREALAVAVASGDADVVAALQKELDAGFATVKAIAKKIAAAEKTVAGDAVAACREALAVAVASGDADAVAALQKELDDALRKVEGFLEVTLATAVASGKEDEAAALQTKSDDTAAKADAAEAALQTELVRSVSELARDQMERDAIKSAFNEFANEDGEIGLERLKKVLQCLGIAASEEEVEKLFTDADADGGGGIDLEEFTTALKTEQWASRDLLGALAGIEQKTMESAFNQFVDEDGEISLGTLGKVLQCLGIAASEAEVALMFKKADVNGGGGIDLEEFTAALKTDQWSQVNQMLKPLGALADMDMDDIKFAFEKFIDGDGEISLERLGEVLKELGIGASNEEVQRMFQQADVDGSGGIDFEEFQVALELDTWAELKVNVGRMRVKPESLFNDEHEGKLLIYDGGEFIVWNEE